MQYHSLIYPGPILPQQYLAKNETQRMSADRRQARQSSTARYSRAFSPLYSGLEGGDEVVHSFVLARHLLHGRGGKPIADPLAGVAVATARNLNPSRRPSSFRRRVSHEHFAEAFVLFRVQLVDLEVVKSHLQRSRVPSGWAVG